MDVKQFASLGGKAKWKKINKKERREWAMKMVEARRKKKDHELKKKWAKSYKSSYDGEELEGFTN